MSARILIAWLAQFYAGILAVLLILRCIVALIGKPQPVPPGITLRASITKELLWLAVSVATFWAVRV